MKYKDNYFKKISYSQQQMDALSTVGISYDKSIKRQLINEFIDPTEISLDTIIEFEKYIQSELPVDYRFFLENTNGGIPEKAVFDLPNKSNIVIAHFFTLDSKVSSYTLKEINDNLRSSFSSNYLAIADTVSGDYILLNINKSDQNYGKIFISLHDTYIDEMNPVLISLSFDKLIEELYE